MTPATDKSPKQPASPTPSGRNRPRAAEQVPVHEENAFVTWLKENKLFLGLIAVAILVGGSVQYYLPRLKAEGRLNSWDQYYTTVSRNSLVALQDQNLGATLDSLRADERTFPWAVVTAARDALSNNDSDSLRAIQPELARLDDSGSFAGLRIVGQDGEPVALVSYLRGRVDAEVSAGGVQFENAPPDGRKVKISIRVDDKETYDLVFGLYEDAAPMACAQFLKAVDAGTLVDETGEFAGDFQLAFDGMAAGEPEDPDEEFILELKNGIFHEAGVLATMTAAGGDRYDLQDKDIMVLVREDAYLFDGRSTVFGALVEGQEGFDRIVEIQKDPANVLFPAQELKVVATEVLP